jgi:hypothetical protein
LRNIYCACLPAWLLTASLHHLHTLTLQPLEDQICQDPEAAGPQFAAAIAAGGEQAQLWTYALLDSNCDDPDAATGAYDVAVDSVNPSGDPADMEAVSR